MFYPTKMSNTQIIPNGVNNKEDGGGNNIVDRHLGLTTGLMGNSDDTEGKGQGYVGMTESGGVDMNNKLFD